MSKPVTIAIDGPAGSGKSSISQQLAERYGYIFVDTGAFYRAITYVLLSSGADLDDIQGIAMIIKSTHLSLENDRGAGHRVIANGEDVTNHMRSKVVENNVSAIAKMPIVRSLLLPLQRQVAAQGNIILAGRDIGTVVLPDAELKLYIDASLAERARHRHRQIVASGDAPAPESIETALAKRDKIDSERSIAPLAVAEDAIYIMTDGCTLEEVVQRISKIIDTWPEHAKSKLDYDK